MKMFPFAPSPTSSLSPARACRPGAASALLLGALCAALALPVQADESTEQIALAAGGRFDQLETILEAKQARGTLDTRDRHALCWAYSQTKRYSKLMECLDQLGLSLQKGSRRTRLFALDDATPSLGIMRAQAWLELGQYPQAIAEAQRNLAWLKQEDSDDLDMLFSTQSILSIAYTFSGDKANGQQMAQQLAQGKPGAYATAKAMALARSRMALGDFAGVIAALESDKTFAMNVFLDRLMTGSFFTGVNNWAWVELPRAYMFNKALLETGRVAEAKAGFERLRAIPQVQANGEIYWLLLNDRARIAEQEKDNTAALDFYRRAIDVVEQQRASINTESGKIGFVGDKQALYGRTIDLALQLKQPTLAYEYIERAKSRALVDLLASKNTLPPLKTASAEASAALENYRKATEMAALQLPLNMAGTAGGGEGRAVAKNRLQELQQRDPELASLVSVGSLPLAEVRQHLRADEVLLEYYMHGKHLVLLAISADSVSSSVIDAATLDGEIRALRSLIEGRKAETVASAQALYNKLLKPVQGLIGTRNLVIIPHGILHYLPFAALHDGKGYLIEKHNLRYLPSASVHKYLRPQRNAALEDMLVFGNPDLGNPALDLPSAEEEAKMIAQMVPRSKILTRLAATETTFKQTAGNYRYLHLATHGEFLGDTPLQSRLILAADKGNDGSLTLGEIYGLRLQADLVTLSACDTGLSKAMNGDDVIGMTRGFLYAGSSNIIASLWEVDDAATAELMKQFYRNIKAGQPKKEALRNAQRTLWTKFPNPVFWAAFYLTGQGV